MFTKNIKDTFTASLLSAVSGVLGEAKKKPCSEGCECEACVPEEDTNEGYMPTNDMPSDKDRKTAGKLGALLKREREAKEKKEPNGVKTEEVEDLDEKRGLWDNIHAKRERIKSGSGERMRKPGSEGAPSAADLKASQTESIDAGLEDELMSQRAGPDGKKWRVERHGKTISTHSSKDAADVKAMKHPSNKVVAKESIDDSFEQIDEISKATMGRYINKAKNSIDLTAWRQGHKEADVAANPKHVASLGKKLDKRHRGIETAVKKLTKEDAEQIDELSKDTMGRYIKKAATKIGTQGVTAGLKIAKDERSQKNFDTIGKRERGIATAVKKLTKEEQDFIDALNDADMEQIDELSNRTLGSSVKKAKKQLSSSDYHVGRAVGAREAGQKSNFSPELERKLAARGKKRYDGIDKAVDKMMTKEEIEQIDELSKDAMLNYLHANKHKNTKDGNPRRDLVKSMRGTDMAVRKYTAKPGSKSVRVPATEEVELDEARGRPKKAGARDFTIHPKTKEKLMHNNPADMKRIERLQKNGILQKPKTEANQHIIQQLQRAKLSMRGGETVNFTHGDPTHVSGTHASKLLDKYAGMKPDEKESFQKKIGHSHANLKSEL